MKPRSSPGKHRKKGSVAPELCPLAARVYLALEYEFAKGFRNMEVWRRRFRRPPSRIEPWLGVTLDAKEINAPGFRRIEVRRQTFHREHQFGHPSLVLLIALNAAPQSAL